MGYLIYNNQNIFLERNNKIILTKYNCFYNFIKNMKLIENNQSQTEYNGLKLNNKNTLVIDLSSLSSATQVFSNDNKIIEMYIKSCLDNLIFTQEDEYNLNKIIEKYLKIMFGENQEANVQVDYLKLLKTNSNIQINNKDDLIKILKKLLKYDNLKQIFIIYKNSILDYFKINEIAKIIDDKICLIEICDKGSIIDKDNNVLIFDNEITQMTSNQFIDLICSKSNLFSEKDKEQYQSLIFKIFFYSIDKNEVELMKKYKNEISELLRIINNEFKLDLRATSDYI